jgi:hypothetical protein
VEVGIALERVLEVIGIGSEGAAEDRTPVRGPDPDTLGTPGTGMESVEVG